MEDVVIIDAARSAVGRKGGSIGGAHPADMLGQVMMQLLARNNLKSACPCRPSGWRLRQ